MKKYLNNKKGVALILTILLMGLVLFLALYFLSFSLTEDRIAISQTQGAKTYYLAEAGIAEMAWKLSNNETYKNNFESNPTWTQTFTRSDPFGANSGYYSVTITNTGLARGTIVSTGSISIGNNTSQRVVKTYVYKALGAGGVPLTAGYADGDINISLSNVDFYNGAAHSNLNFIVNLMSTVNVDTDLRAVKNFIQSFTSTVSVGGDYYAANMPNGAAEQIDMPAVDFDSASSNSYKNKADAVYTQSEFDNLMKDNQVLTLNDPITYVIGDVDARGAQTLIINGLLVVERDFQLGRIECRSSRCGVSNLTINDTSSSTPSGILAKRRLQFDSWTGNVDIHGALYADDELDIVNLPSGYSFKVNGGLLGRKLTVTSVWHPIEIYYNNFIIDETLPPSDYSPVITVEHWEEEY